MTEVITVKHSLGSYDIAFKDAKNAWDSNPDAFVITDENVARITGISAISESRHLVLPAGESTKSMQYYEQILSWLVNHRCKRNDTIIALGGGVIGDLVGFVAATYMRGIRYLQVPTTLLSQVDSSVGGKVAVDLKEGKNLVGAFYPPSEVIVDISMINSLPEREFQCGVAEVIKYGWIGDSNLIDELQAATLKPGDRRLANIIRRCIDHKRRIVESDEHETLGIRAKLNFGHTIGHAIEKVTDYAVYTHGEAISIGMNAEAKLAEIIGFAKTPFSKALENQLQAHGLPTALSAPLDTALLMNAMRIDKKNDSAGINFALVSKPGECELVRDVDAQAIKEVLTLI